MDIFQRNAFEQSIDGNDTIHQALALMGYLKDGDKFVKRFGYMLMNAKLQSDNKWYIYFLFQDKQNEPNCWVSKVIELTEEEQKNVKTICEVIAHIENYSFKTFHNGKILGIHHEDMGLSWQRKFKIANID